MRSPKMLIASANVLARDRSPGIGAATWVDCGVHPAPATLWVDCSGPEFEKRALHLCNVQPAVPAPRV